MILHDLVHDDECYVATVSGQRLYLLAPEASQINIDDIVHGLAYQPCYSGQTSHFYSLAQHSLLVASLVPAGQRLAALLHDAVCAYLGNLAQSMRPLLPGFSLIEARVKAAISERFAVSGLDTTLIQRAHQIAQSTEQRDLLPHEFELRRPGGAAPVPRRIEFLSPEEAKRQFQEMFIQLLGKTSVRQPVHAMGMAG